MTNRTVRQPELGTCAVQHWPYAHMYRPYKLPCSLVASALIWSGLMYIRRSSIAPSSIAGVKCVRPARIRRRNLHMSAYSLLTSVKCRHLAYSQWRREEVGGRAILYVFGMESGVVRSKLCLSVEDSCCIQYHSWRISVLGYFYVGSVRGEVSQTSTTLPLHL